jgi:hypothetical protein
MIPPILHQTWKSKTDLPENFRFWRQSFADLNPGLELRLYDDADNRALLERTFPALLPLYDSYPSEIFRVDFIRPVYMFSEGGFYADLDFQCLQPLSLLELDAEIVLGRLAPKLRPRQSIPNAFMVSQPGEGFWLGYLALCERAWKRLRHDRRYDMLPELVVGPMLLHRAVLNYQRDKVKFIDFVRQFVRQKPLDVDADAVRFGNLALVPGPILYPIDWREEEHRALCRAARDGSLLYSVDEARQLFPQSVAVTYWASSWRDKSAFEWDAATIETRSSPTGDIRQPSPMPDRGSG